MASLHRLSISFVTLVVLGGCGSTVAPSDGSPPGPDATADAGQPDAVPNDTPVMPDASTRVPLNHRPDNAACLTTPPAVNCNFGSGGPPGVCTADSQCVSGNDGRCAASPGGGVALCECTYDACSSDTQCTMGGPCACHGAAYTGSLGNACVPGNCQVDANCGAGGYCSPSQSTTNCGGLGGYYCHTSHDDCVNDSDCATTGQGQQICSYSMTSSKWTCGQLLLCG